MSSKWRPRTLKWNNEMPIIQNTRYTLSRPSWRLRPTNKSPRATEPNWSSVNNEVNNLESVAASAAVNMSANNLARQWAPLINEGISVPARPPTANEQTYGLRPTRLPAKATLQRLRASRKLASKPALTHTESGGPQFMFGDHLRDLRNQNKFTNTRSLEARIKGENDRRLHDPESWHNEMAQRMSRRTAGFNVPAPGVMKPEYPDEVPAENVSYALNLTKAGYPLASETFTPRGWGKWKNERKGRNWKHPSNTPVPDGNGSTTPGGTPNTPGRRTRRRQEHLASTLERFAGVEPPENGVSENNLSGNTPGGTIAAPGASRARHFSGTPGFFAGTPMSNNSGTPGAY
jgi:hypothetical protein